MTEGKILPHYANKYLLRKLSNELGRSISKIDDETIELLERHSYSGNIRELENIIERAVIFCKGNSLTVGHLPCDLHDLMNALVTALPKENNEEMHRFEIALGRSTLADIEVAVIEQCDANVGF